LPTITTDAIQSFEVSLRDQNGKLIQLNDARYELSLLIEQRLSYEFEMDHPAHPYPEISGRRSLRQTDEEAGEDKEEAEDKDREVPVGDRRSLPDELAARAPTIGGLSIDPRSPRPQPLGGSAIPILSSTPAAPVSIPTVKRPRIDEEQLQRQEMELDQAIMLAHSL
jgi:hypothetical protein